VGGGPAGTGEADDGLDELVRDFLLETEEGLVDVDRALVALEADPTSSRAPALLAAVFRTVHTVKGTCGFLDLPRLEELAHAGETLLVPLRDGARVLEPATTDVLLHLVDGLRAVLAVVAATGSDAGADTAGLLAEVAACAAAGTSASAPPAAEPVPLDAAPAGTPAPAAPSRPPAPAASTDVRGAEQSVRVDVEVLEELVALVGELVLTRNQVVERAARSGDAEVVRAAHRLDVVAGSLQRSVMQTRMQPMEHAWASLPRVVRDLGHQLGRQVRLVTEGGGTELDRTLLEAVKDPLLHLVRNAVDHGLEPPEGRRAAGKEPTGTLTLRARHESGQVVVEVVDDGRGMDPATIAARAYERGVADEATLRRMSTGELLALVFTPGFSTATEVTAVSGRGVGMDVVRTNVERIGGSVELDSVPGRGTTTRLRVPLTLAIVPALLVGCAGDRYALPQGSLRELVALTSGGTTPGGVVAGAVSGTAERVGGVEVMRLRGRLLPLVRLRAELGLPPAAPGEGAVVAVLETAGRRFGLVVDAVHASQEIVVKPLGRHLRAVPAYAGATILGDGGLALILDVPSLARSTREGDRPALEAPAAAPVVRVPLLLVDVGRHRVGIPLPAVARLDEVADRALERLGTRWAARRRGDVLTVVDLADHLARAAGERREPRRPGSASGRPAVPLVVLDVPDGDAVGLVVGAVLDVVEVPADEVRPAADGGLAGVVEVDGRLVGVLDAAAVLAAAARPPVPGVEVPRPRPAPSTTTTTVTAPGGPA
jgi:two-component system, chemotaxis family, sensor kinase CheA